MTHGTTFIAPGLDGIHENAAHSHPSEELHYLPNKAAVILLFAPPQILYCTNSPFAYSAWAALFSSDTVAHLLPRPAASTVVVVFLFETIFSCFQAGSPPTVSWLRARARVCVLPWLPARSVCVCP